MVYSRMVILVVEDSVDDRRLFERAVSECGSAWDLRLVSNGAGAMDYLRHRGSYTEAGASPEPNLILVDLDLPRMGGFAVCNEIKGDPLLRRIPVIIVSDSCAWEDAVDCYDLGANAYVSKPSTLTGTVDFLRALASFWCEQAWLPNSGQAFRPATSGASAFSGKS